MSRPSQIDALASGVTITTTAQRDRPAKALTAPTAPCTVRRVNPRAPKVLEFVLKEGRNRQIRKMVEARGLKVRTLHRTHFANIGLEGLRLGQWTELTPKELKKVDAALQEYDADSHRDSDDDGADDESHAA